MKYDVNRSFGYPVLRQYNSDYSSGSFQPSVRPLNVKKGDEYANFEAYLSVSPKELNILIENKQAFFAIILDCRDTFYREVFKFYKRGDVNFKVKSENFTGKIEIESYIIAEKEINSYSCSYINAEFNKQSFNFLPGMILAQANTEEWHIRNENFRDLTGLIDLKINEAFEDGEWTYDISSDNQPIVYTSLSQKEIIANRNYDPIFINVILAPMVTEMLYKMNDDGENYEDTAWAQTIEDLLIKNKLNKDSYNSDYARIARKLLGIPTRKLNTYLGV
jgi:hypothetical protein